MPGEQKMTRDPRIDPMPGDKVVGLSGLMRTVEKLTGMRGDLIGYTSRNGSMGYTLLRQWRKWAKDAEVVQIGEGK